MTVTAITAVNRQKSRVCLEGAADPAFSSFVLSNRDILSLDLREGGEVDPGRFSEILQALRAACLLRCGSLLGSRDYTRQRLLGKLCDAGFPLPVAEQAADEMEEAHYLDDRRFAQNYISCHVADRSMARIRMDLKRLGVSDEDLSLAMEAVREEAPGGSRSFSDAEEEQIRAFLAKKHYDPASADFRERQRIMAALYRRGFSQEMIRRVIRDV